MENVYNVDDIQSGVDSNHHVLVALHIGRSHTSTGALNIQSDTDFATTKHRAVKFLTAHGRYSKRLSASFEPHRTQIAFEARVGRSALSDCPEKASRPPLRRCVVCDPSKNQQLAYACPTYPGRRREEVDREVGGGDCAEA
jgi:hypothetical protein